MIAENEVLAICPIGFALMCQSETIVVDEGLTAARIRGISQVDFPRQINGTAGTMDQT